jgi:hypothetical protein
MGRVEFAAALCVILTVEARGDLITFDDLPPTYTSGDRVPAGYGSGPNISVSYQERSGFGNASQVRGDLGFWQLEYGDLENVVWGLQNNASHVAEVTLAATAENVTLTSFELGGWLSDRPGRSVRVYDADSACCGKRTA